MFGPHRHTHNPLTPKIDIYLECCELTNQFGTRCSSREVLGNKQIIVLHFASVHDTDVDLQQRLRRLYDAMRFAENRRVPRLEILHVPVDLDEEQCRRSFREQAGLWYTIQPCNDAIHNLMASFGVVGTPTVKAIDAKGDYVTRFAERELREYGANALCLWF